MRKNYRGNYRTGQEQLKNKRAQHLLCANFFPFSSFSYPRNFTRNLLSSDIFPFPCLFPFEMKKKIVSAFLRSYSYAGHIVIYPLICMFAAATSPCHC